MAYLNGKRTVYCHRCGDKGHNRRNCPLNTPEQKAAYKNGAQARQCSYCHETGHTKPRCEKRKVDMAQYVRENAVYRREVLDQMVKEGLGLGSLVTQELKDYRGNDIPMLPEHLHIVTNIDWDAIQVRDTNKRTIIAHNILDGYSDSFALPKSHHNPYVWKYTTVVNRVKEESIRNNVPSSWIDGATGLDKIFK